MLQTTIKAIAINAGLENSDVVTLAYTIVSVSTIAEVRAMAYNQMFKLVVWLQLF